MNNKKRYILFYVFVMILILIQASYGEDKYIEQFGKTKGSPVNKGFVFLDGQYIDPPYVISREGLTLFVNGKKIKRPTRHPGEKPLFEGIEVNQLSDEKKKRLSRLLETTRQIYENYLENGYCHFFSSHGGYIRCDIYNTVNNLPNTLNILKSTKTKKLKLRSIHQAGWHNFVGDDALNDLIDNYSASPKFEARINLLAVSLLYIDEFGIEKGETIRQGFLFVDGKYIDVPYVVIRKGLALFVNDQMIQPPMHWPIPEEKNFVNTRDAVLPLTITKDSSKYDPDVRKYLSNKNAYLREHYSQREAVQILAKAYKNLPCVEHAEFDVKDPAILIVTWSDGSVNRTRLIPIIGREPIKKDKNSILKRLSTQRKNYENRLRKGDYYFFSTGGGRITGGAARAGEILPRIVPILRSSKPMDEKLRKIREAGFPGDNESAKALVSGFYASPQLEQRLSEMTKIK